MNLTKKGNCELCEKYSEKLEIMVYNNDEDKWLCPECWDSEGMRGDYEYDRQREEEYDPDNPDHERV